MRFPRAIGVLLGLRFDLGIAVASAPPRSVGQIFRHHDERQSVAYGIQLPEGRAPLAFAEVVDEELARYLRDDPSGPFAGAAKGPVAEDLGSWGFGVDKAEPIFKADWHALSFWGDSSDVFVPRKNALTPLPRAPPRVIAFIDAFRQVNSACWKRIVDALGRLREKAGAEEQKELVDIVGIFQRAVESRSHFAAIEAQIWSGGHLVMQSHTDGATAMLHLGLTLGGRRTLRVGKFSERHSPYRDQPMRRRGRRTGDEISVWNDEAYDERDIWDVAQVDGSAYLSLPFCFEHGVQYDSDTSQPVMALQCRFAFVNESEALEVNGQRTGNMREVAETVADALAAAVDHNELRLPSLDEVQAVEAHLALVDGPQSPLPRSRRDARPAQGTSPWMPPAFGAAAILCGWCIGMRFGARQCRRRPRSGPPYRAVPTLTPASSYGNTSPRQRPERLWRVGHNEAKA